MSRFRVGTYEFMAPEVIRGPNYSAPADVYSTGATLLMLRCGVDCEVELESGLGTIG